MNKELYIKREKQLEELNRMYSLVNWLQKFLSENEKNFKMDESIESLKKIKMYFEQKEKEHQDFENKVTETYKELCSTCKHEIAIRYSNRPYSYICLICNCALKENSDMIPNDSLISIDTTKDYEVAYIIEKVFKEVVYSEKDLIETIDELVEELQYDRNIKVYRRSK